MNQAHSDHLEHAVVLFDGECTLCNGVVRFISKRDPAGYFHYAPLQGKFGQKLQEQLKLDPAMKSFILLEHGQIYQKSDAALSVCKKLKGAWRLLAWLRFIPRPIRDLVYRFVAANRYRWFGKQKQCMIPSPQLKSRFYE